MHAIQGESTLLWYGSGSVPGPHNKETRLNDQSGLRKEHGSGAAGLG